MKRKNHEFARLCGCQGKVRFESFDLAKQAAQNRGRRKRSRKRREPYHCRYCDGFHIGTPDKGPKKRGKKDG